MATVMAAPIFVIGIAASVKPTSTPTCRGPAGVPAIASNSPATLISGRRTVPCT